MKIRFTVSKRLTVSGDIPDAYLPWEEQIRNVPRDQKTGFMWVKNPTRRTLDAESLEGLAGKCNLEARRMLRDFPQAECVRLEGSVMIGDTRVTIDIQLDRAEVCDATG